MIDKLFLELSQVTKAKTNNEIKLESEIILLKNYISQLHKSLNISDNLHSQISNEILTR